MKNLKNISDIDRYLNGELGEEDMIDMEVRLLVDEDFRRSFETTKTLISGIKASAKTSSLQDKLDRLQTLKSPDQDQQSRGSAILSFLHKKNVLRYGIAAAVLLALVVVALLTIGQNPTPEQLFADNFEISPNLDYRASRGSGQDPEITQAYRAYDQGLYAQAIDLLEKLILKGDDPLIHQYYLGNCHLALENWPEAITALQAPADANFHLANDAKWYLGLAYLGQGDTKNAIPLLRESSRLLDREQRARKMLRTLKE